jgi:cobalt/nickel transport system permease protein
MCERIRQRLLDSDEAVLTVAASALIANLVTHSILFTVGLAALAVALLSATGLKPGDAVRRFLMPSYLALVAASTQLFTVGHSAMFSLGPLEAHWEGLASGLLVGAKIIAGTMVVFWFGMALRIPRESDLSAARFSASRAEDLAAKLRLPSDLVEIAALMYRYLFLLGEESERIRHAQLLRLGDASWRTNVKSFGTLVGMIVVRSLDRTEAVYEAMALRGAGWPRAGAASVARADIAGFVAGAPIALILLGLGYAL